MCTDTGVIATHTFIFLLAFSPISLVDSCTARCCDSELHFIVYCDLFVMIIHAAMIWTLISFLLYSHLLLPSLLSYCFPFRVLVPYGCTHSPSWRLYCSRWLIPRIPVLGGCVSTTISITSESVVVLQTCIRFYLATITVSPCEPVLPRIFLYLAVEASLNPRLNITTDHFAHADSPCVHVVQSLARKSHNTIVPVTLLFLWHLLFALLYCSLRVFSQACWVACSPRFDFFIVLQ